MSDTTPKPDVPEDAALAIALVRAEEIVDRIAQRRNEVLDRRGEALALTQALAKSEALRKAVGRELAPRLAEIAKASDENLGRIETDRKSFAEAMKKARAVLTPRKRRRSIS